MKTVLLLGDSIRQNYQEYVEQALSGKAKVLYTRDNGRFCQYTLRYLYEWVRALTEGHGEEIDIVHFNCGLWDVLRLAGEERTFNSESEYKELLERIYNRLRVLCPNAKIIFALTTEVIEPGFEPGVDVGERRNGDIIRFNEIAKELFEGLSVEINDLWTVSRSLPKEAHSDAVHYETSLGREMLGKKVSKCILDNLDIE